MLAGIFRGLLMFAMLMLFIWTDKGLLMLASAMCAGAIIGSEAYEGQWFVLPIFYLTICFLFGDFYAKGAAMAAFFLPPGAGKLDGLAAFLMAAAVGGYAFWETRRTMEYLEKMRAGARY